MLSCELGWLTDRNETRAEIIATEATNTLEQYFFQQQVAV